MIKYGFFNAVNGVPSYNADDVNRYFEGLVSNGVYKQYGDALKVTAGDGMSVLVGKGKASVNYHYMVSDTAERLTIDPSHVTYGRYTLIILHYNVASRAIYLTTKNGDMADTPTYPELLRGDGVYEIALAAVYVGAGATSITDDDIADLRSNAELCGWATLTSALNINTYIQQTQANYTTTTTEQYIDLPSGVDNYEVGDVLQVFVNGVLYVENIDYTMQLNEVTGKYMVVGTQTLEPDNTLTFILLKSKVADVIL